MVQLRQNMVNSWKNCVLVHVDVALLALLTCICGDNLVDVVIMCFPTYQLNCAKSVSSATGCNAVCRARVNHFPHKMRGGGGGSTMQKVIETTLMFRVWLCGMWPWHW